MKLKNKKTGEVSTLTLSSNGEDLLLMKNDEMITRKVKLSDLEEWEDYEEPKSWWYIDCNGEVFRGENADKEHTEEHKSIGNYYTSSKEAEKAVEKLKAWKRVKDNGISFGVKVIDREWYLAPKAVPQQRTFDDAQDVFKDIKFVFGIEE